MSQRQIIRQHNVKDWRATVVCAGYKIHAAIDVGYLIAAGVTGEPMGAIATDGHTPGWVILPDGVQVQVDPDGFPLPNYPKES